jgi:hypothetical protein
MKKTSLSREQELFLIGLGIKSLLEVGQQFTSNGNATQRDPISHRQVVKKVRRKTKKRWSPEQRQKFMKTMKAVWKKKREQQEA